MRHNRKVWQNENVKLNEMSNCNSCRDLRLRLEGCSTGEDSIDEPQTTQCPTEKAIFSVALAICDR